MREISCQLIHDRIKEALIDMSENLSQDVVDALQANREKESWPIAQQALDIILENQNIARDTHSPMCQDTGMVVCFVDLGQEVHLVEGQLEEAINRAVADAYTEAYLRKSVVEEPLFDRKNTEDNSPAVIHVRIVPGEGLKIGLAAKGFGSENMSRITMLKPADGLDGVKNFIVETAKNAGPNACPPFVVGVGVGGTFDKAATMAKHSLLRPINEKNADPQLQEIEEECLERINASGVGPQGYGGHTTALRVLMETYPTHIAGLPVAVNINCHASRHRVFEI